LQLVGLAIIPLEVSSGRLSLRVLKSLAYDDETSTQGKNVYPGYISKFNPDQVYFGK